MPETLVVPAELAALGRVNAWLDEIAERMSLPAPTLFGMRLCLEEAVSNVVRHGFPDTSRPPGTVCLVVTHDSATVTLAINDNGIAFNPCEAAEPVLPDTLDDAAIGGLGVHLMRRFALGMEYRRLGETNCLVLHFDRAQSGTTPQELDAY